MTAVSLKELVIEMVFERGKATVDDLMPKLSELGYTRDQAIKALHNCKQDGILACEGKPSRAGRPRYGSDPAVYYLSPNPPEVKRQRTGGGRKAHNFPATSVWDLGLPPRDWIVPKGDRQYILLGGWDE